MNALNPTSPVHFYDTHLHQILCGLHGFEHRSSKHSRNVTCQACVALLGPRREADTRPGSHLPSEGAGTGL